MRLNFEIKLIEIEIKKLETRIEITESLGLFKHEYYNESLRNLKKIQNTLKQLSSNLDS